MITIFINEIQVILADNKANPPMDFFPIEYNGQAASLLQYIDLIESGNIKKDIFISYEKLQVLAKDFWSHYKVIKAAGGLVQNEEKEYLLIHRNGYWDLPKGKLEKNEKIEAAAIREVEEETGIVQLKLGKPLKTTFHTYYNKKNKRILKHTYWFKMSGKKMALTPQSEEGIDKAVWMKATDALSIKYDIYGNIRKILHSNIL